MKILMLFLALLPLSLAAHEHHAPHGGQLVELGEEFGHVELLLDAGSGKLDAWVLDGEAEKAVRIKAKTLILNLKAGKKVKTVVLKAVANPLTGETVGDTSQFGGLSPDLKGKAQFGGNVESINLLGKTFKKAAFSYPAAQEKGHGEEKKGR